MMLEHGIWGTLNLCFYAIDTHILVQKEPPLIPFEGKQCVLESTLVATGH